MKNLFLSVLVILIVFLFFSNVPQNFTPHTDVNIFYAKYYTRIDNGDFKNNFPRVRIKNEEYVFKVINLLIIKKDSAYMFWKPYNANFSVWGCAKLSDTNICDLDKYLNGINFHDTSLYPYANSKVAVSLMLDDGPSYSFCMERDRMNYSFSYSRNLLPQISKLHGFLNSLLDSLNWQPSKPQVDFTNLANPLLKEMSSIKHFDKTDYKPSFLPPPNWKGRKKR